MASSENILKVLNYIFKTEGVKELIFDERVPLDSINPSRVDLLPHNCIVTDNTNIIGTVKETIENGCYMEGLDGNQFILKKALVTYYGENTMSKIVIGIDLGTTFSGAAILDESGKPKMIPNKNGKEYYTICSYD